MANTTRDVAQALISAIFTGIAIGVALWLLSRRND